MTRDVLDSKFKRPKSHGMVYYYYPYLKGLFGWFDSMFQARSPRFPPDFGELSRPHFFLPFFSFSLAGPTDFMLSMSIQSLFMGFTVYLNKKQ